ncbi:hypothetical protein CAL29_28235 [Bordetella genomosp. 10]|uniref:Uncharacterized protein n=1 Tax=Bordetella genomosp. 10 TaxID=1416804 RepID=A0A261S3M5_9BORD|nr:hypothetical protein [Bordetella genomosp. 10]OZI31761.1 hypothetical protein CAL29_28235 [Bordetella genomosp. 10]
MSNAPRPIPPRTWHAMRRAREIERHDAHFAELTEVKAQLHLERAQRGRLEAALTEVIKSLEEGWSPMSVAREARIALGLPTLQHTEEAQQAGHETAGQPEKCRSDEKAQAVQEAPTDEELLEIGKLIEQDIDPRYEFLDQARALMAFARDAALQEACRVLVDIDLYQRTYSSGYPRHNPREKPAAAVVAEAVVAINAARTQRAGSGASDE